MAELLFLRSGELQMRAALPTTTSLILGRGVEAQLVIPDKGVSRVQCEITPRGQGYALIDRSGRGTPVSNRTANDLGSMLRDGDTLHLGDYEVVYSAGTTAEGAEPTRPVGRRRGQTVVGTSSAT